MNKNTLSFRIWLQGCWAPLQVSFSEVYKSYWIIKVGKKSQRPSKLLTHHHGHWLISLSATFPHFLNSSRDSDFTTSSLGSLLQYITTLSRNNFFPNTQSWTSSGATWGHYLFFFPHQNESRKNKNSYYRQTYRCCRLKQTQSLWNLRGSLQLLEHPSLGCGPIWYMEKWEVFPQGQGIPQVGTSYFQEHLSYKDKKH